MLSKNYDDKDLYNVSSLFFEFYKNNINWRTEVKFESECITHKEIAASWARTNQKLIKIVVELWQNNII